MSKENNTYIAKELLEADFETKIEEMIYLKRVMEKKRNEYMFFNKSTIFKASIAMMFADYVGLNEYEKNRLVTACLVCNCKKRDSARTPEELKKDIDNTRIFLKMLGFSDEFCYDCEQLNRYSQTDPRTDMGDMLELIEQFGGLLLDRPERKGFSPEEALEIMKKRNLKDYTNRFLNAN